MFLALLWMVMVLMDIFSIEHYINFFDYGLYPGMPLIMLSTLGILLI